MAIGLFLISTNLVLVGAVLFSAVLLFQVVTLPVEFNASNRAKALIMEHGIITAQEREGMDRVLNAAALTYVAAAVSTLLTLLYFLWRAGLLGRCWYRGNPPHTVSVVERWRRHPPSIMVRRIPMVSNHVHVKHFSKMC